MQPTPWLLRRPAHQHRLRLYCFCYAGGNAVTYLPWQQEINPAIEICAVQLPGRGARMAEAPYSVLRSLIQALAPVIGQRNDLPFAFFGHSLGGLVAFELARYLRLHYLPVPRHLIVSGCSAPQRRDRSRNLHRLPDAEFLTQLKTYNGTPPEIFAHAELMALLLPTIRADFTLVEEYRYLSSLPLQVPITVLAGRNDPHVDADQAQAWQLETLAECRVEWFDGDHFFIQPERVAVLRCIEDALDISLGRSFPAQRGYYSTLISAPA